MKPYQEAYEKVCLVVDDETGSETKSLRSDEEVDEEALPLCDKDNTSVSSSLQRRFPGGNDAWLWPVNVALTVTLSVALILWVSSDHPQCSIQSVEPTNVTATASQPLESKGWVRPEKVYGFVHVAKTAGTQLNGLLASKYERVCGNKGYSYDFKAHNDVVKVVAKQAKVSQMYYGPEKTWKQNGEPIHPDRGLYLIQEMEEIGWDDCDYIAHEELAPKWLEIANSSLDGIPLELHVPCRDPLSHMMSTFNYFQLIFDCEEADWVKQVKEKIPGYMFEHRMRSELEGHPNVALKCFNSVPPDNYVDYMGTILQKRRVEVDYFPRSTNSKRNKTAECIWTQPEDVKAKFQQQLRDAFFYYEFCDRCMGSKDELPLQLL